MLKYIQQNKQVIMVAVALFIVSMSALLFFLGSNTEFQAHDLKTDVIETVDHKPAQNEETHYRQLLKNNEDPFVVMNVNGSINFTSSNFESTLGYSEKEAQNQVFFNLLNPEDLSIFLGGFGKVLQSEQGVTIVGPYRIRDKKGDFHLHIGSAVPVVVKGKIEKIVLSTKDISAQVPEDKTPETPTENQTHQSSNSGGKKIRNENNKVENRLMAEKPAEDGE